MFDLRKYYQDENENVMDSYKENLKRITDIYEKLRNSTDTSEKKFDNYFRKAMRLILKFAELEEKINPHFFQQHNFVELRKMNFEMYEEFLLKNYQTSFTNPSFCVEQLGEGIGQLFCYLYSKLKFYIDYAFQHRIYQMAEWNEIFLEVFDYVTRDEINLNRLKEIITHPDWVDRTRDYEFAYKQMYDPNYRFYSDVIMNDDLTDQRHLFKFGKYITDNEINMANFLSSYPQVRISMLAKAIVTAYQRGFIRDGKDITKKSSVTLVYRVGMEKLYREVIKEFEKINLHAAIYSTESSPVNRQYMFDHKQDEALYIDPIWVEKRLEYMRNGLEANKKILGDLSGIVMIMNFGEKPFSPENNPHKLKFNEMQTKEMQFLQSEGTKEFQKYQPRTETSFSIIAFPSTEVGEKFEEMFEATIEVNMVDTEKYERIQQKMIEVLDNADKVHIKGKNDNKTDLIIRCPELKKPEEQTNFVNSGSNVNVPAGEIYTSPQLQGTTGILHVFETYQDRLLYKNLEVVLEDGYVKDYNCSNFDSEEENKKYIEENLLFPHKTLPIGEFAIGTNTLAYVFARKYDILDILPILITEKTAPHFALGDTCFARSESVPRHNQFTKKKIAAYD
ncbi:MAG: aminopeptidase, partial [Candidatus Thorarchaeota archaeon]